MSGLTTLLVIIGFYYLLRRIKKLEKAVYSFKEEGGIVSPEKPQREELEHPSVLEEEITPSPPEPEAEVIPEKKRELSDLLPGGEFEFKFGSKITTGIGILAIIFAVSFFLRYAFENNLISEPMRIIMGLIAGVIILLIGELTRERFPTYSQIVTGGGLGVLYLSLYVAFNNYQLISQVFAFLGMALVTMTGIFLAVRYNSIVLAGFTQIGGLLTPLLVSTGTNRPHQLFIYLALLDIALIIIARWKLWRLLTFEGFIGTVIIYGGWFFKFYTPQQMALAQGYATLFFVIFLAVSVLQHLFRRSPQDEADFSLLSANPLFYFALSYWVINPQNPEWMGFFTFSLSALYFILALLLKEGEGDRLKFRQFLTAIALLFSVIAVPIQFEKSWIAIAWAAEALILTYLGLKNRLVYLQWFSQPLFLISFFYLLFFNTKLGIKDVAWLNARFFGYFASIVLFLVGAYIYSKVKESSEKRFFSDSVVLSPQSLLYIQIFILSIISVSAEINDFYGKFWLAIWWSIVALAGGYISFSLNNTSLRFCSHLTFLAIFFQLLDKNTRLGFADYTPIFNSRVFSFLISILAMGLFLFLLRSYKERLLDYEKYALPVLFIMINFLLLWLFSYEVVGYFENKFQLLPEIEKRDLLVSTRYRNIENVSLSITWTLYAIVVFVIGVIKKTAPERMTGIFLFGLVILKVFLYDTASLGDFYRFISFLTLGIILLLTGYLYYRYRERITSFFQAKATEEENKKVNF